MPTSLITGASAGIGAELARLFAADGHDVVLVARSRERLDRLAAEMRATRGITAWPIPMDLSDPAAPAALGAELADRGLTVEFLVNNAGFGLLGPFAETDLDAELRMIQLNVATLTRLTKLLLPSMIARRSGRILNVGSVAGFLPGPLMSVYYATKAYVVSFSQALAEELRGSGVTVTTLCPGPTRSEFHAAAGVRRTPALDRIGMTAEAVARAGYAGMMAGRRLVIPGFGNKLITLWGRLVPSALVVWSVRRIMETRR